MNFQELDTLLLQHQNKIIHQVWFNLGAGDTPTESKYSETWRKLNSDHYYHLWSESQALELIKSVYPFFLDYYVKYPHGIQRIDAIRYFFLHRYGGWYVDIDVECLKPIKEITKKYNRSLYFVESANNLMSYRSISNCLIFSLANHAFWIQVHQSLISSFQDAYMNNTLIILNIL